MTDVDRECDAELDAALIGGREERDVVVVDYSPDWPRRFEDERRRILAAEYERTKRDLAGVGAT